MALQLLCLSMSGTRIRCRELLSGDYSSLLVHASLVGAVAVSRKTVWLKMQIMHNVKNETSLRNTLRDQQQGMGVVTRLLTED